MFLMCINLPIRQGFRLKQQSANLIADAHAAGNYSIMRKALLILLTGVISLGFFAAAPAIAEDIGSPAVVLSDTTLLSGPGVRYPAAGTVVASQDVTVVRCSNRWCHIAEGDGWMSIDELSFGNFERRPFHGTVYNWGRGGPGKVCFHDDANFSGESLCLPSGTVARDLALLGWDDRISSISINGNVSVNVCRDRNFASYCELVTQSQVNVNRLLNNSASSWQVW